MTKPTPTDDHHAATGIPETQHVDSEHLDSEHVDPEDLDPELLGIEPAPQPEEPGEADSDRQHWYTRRQVLAASFAGLVLGVGVGMAFTTKSWVDRERNRNRPTDVDLGFVNDMLDHHDQAVQMSLITLNTPGISGGVRQFATEVVIFQRYEIGLLEGRLNVWGEERGAEDRTAMAWMGMGTNVNDMPGMARPSDLERLRNATGIGADREFLTLMRAHHEGGVHMAEYAAANASDTEVVALAARMANVQKLEVTEYTRFLDALPKS